jgi:hypothetical protein
MERKAQEFSASAALAETEFQERLLRALAREMAQLRGESQPAPRNGPLGLNPAETSNSGAAEPSPNRTQEDVSCD